MELDGNIIAFGLLWFVAFLFSTTCHEAAHAWAAKRGGDLTAYAGGQVTLDPLPHIRREPMGMVLIPWVSFFVAGWMMGWASAPYNPGWAREYPRRAAWMALAGPMANFTLVGVAAIGIHTGIAAGWFTQNSYSFAGLVEATTAGPWEAVAALLSILFSLNLLLGVFNLIPIPPLDGFSVLGLLLPDDMTRRLMGFRDQMAQMTILGVLIAWQLFDEIFFPVYYSGVDLLLWSPYR